MASAVKFFCICYRKVKLVNSCWKSPFSGRGPLVTLKQYAPLIIFYSIRDMFGCCGSPLRITKTIVVSKNPSLLNTYLHVLSYFIRTSDVSFHRFEPVTVPSSHSPSNIRLRNEPPQNTRTRQHHSGDNLRSGTWLNKSKRTSGTKSRLPSFDDQVSFA